MSGIQCTHLKTSVTDSRPSTLRGAETVRRRRKCLFCKAKFPTYELSENSISHVSARLSNTVLRNIISDKFSDMMLALKKEIDGVFLELSEDE